MRMRTAIIAGVASIFIALIVVVLSSVVLHLAWSGGTSAGSVHSYVGGSSSFRSDLRDNKVRSVEIDVNDNTMKVTLTSGSVYSVDFPDMAQLTSQLAQHPDVEVTSAKGGSSWWPSAFWLLIPSLLIILILAVLIFLALRRWLRGPPGPSADDLSVRLADLQGRVEHLEERFEPPSGTST